VKSLLRAGHTVQVVYEACGQFLLYAPKKAGGAKVKMGPVTAAITG
jgi:hypothetical protein